MGNGIRVRPGSGHPNWCGCAGCRRDIAATETGLLKLDAAMIAGCALIAGVAWVALAPLRIWHRTGADGHMHPVTATWIAYGTGGALLLACLMFFSIRAAAKAGRAARPALTPAAAEALEIARTLPPPCRHPRAVKVDSAVNRKVTLENWCPDCETQLGPAFRWPCCGAAPGASPGAGHAYNCPHLKGSPS